MITKVEIKPIQTNYKGYRFRSRLEARWAVFFDAMGYRWEYEPEGYILEGGERYLPDFWLPEYKMFAEVKPQGGRSNKIHLLAIQSKTAGVCLCGLPRFDYYPCLIWCPYSEDQCLDGFVCLDDADHDKTFRFRPFDDVRCQALHGNNEWWKMEGCYSQEYRDSVNAAKSARFEHGESGRTL